MNIFVLDENPKLAAQYQCDKHVVKMTLETAQLLCSVYEDAPYRRTHYNHPCSIWVRESVDNFSWLIVHGIALANEYTFRYGKVHKSQAVIEWARNNPPQLPEIGLTKHVLCMPEEYKISCVVTSYRNYYRGDKSRFASWRRDRVHPTWWVDNI